MDGVSHGQLPGELVCDVLWPLGEGPSEKSMALGEWWKEGYGCAQDREEECSHAGLIGDAR